MADETLFRWVCLDIDGNGLADEVVELFSGAPAGQLFASRAEAEAWLHDVYPDLAEAGAASVTLYEGDSPVYTMSLSA